MVNEFSGAGSAIALVVIALSLIMDKLPNKPKSVEKRAQEIVFEEKAYSLASQTLEKDEPRDEK